MYGIDEASCLGLDAQRQQTGDGRRELPSAHVLVDDFSKGNGWQDATDPGAGDWRQLALTIDDLRQRDLMAVHIDEQVLYKSIRDIHPQDNMLLYAREAFYPTIDIDSLARQNCAASEASYSCSGCGELFRSNVALSRHQTYSCTSTISLYSSLEGQMSSKRNSKAENRILNIHSGCNIDDSRVHGCASSDSSNPVSQGTDSDDNKSDDSFLEPFETGSDGQFKCEECPKSFQWKANLQRHQLTHDADRKFPCENCDKIFTDPSNLQRHIRSQHVGARSHACTDCGKTFATSSGLKQHQHIHSSIKPFQCEVCLKAYTQFSNLCRHKRMHADCRQQIKCKDCGQAFSTVTSLSKHKRFCEGVIRKEMGTTFSCDKLSSVPHVGQREHHNTSIIPCMYATRPQFPFSTYQFGAFPNLFSQGLSAMLNVSSESHATALRLAAGMHQSLENSHNLSHAAGLNSSRLPSFLSPLGKHENIDVNDQVSDTTDSEISEDTNELDMRTVSDDDCQGYKYPKRVFEASPDSLQSASPDSENLRKMPKLDLASLSPSQSPQDNRQSKGMNSAPSAFSQLKPQSLMLSSKNGSRIFTSQSPISVKQDTSTDISRHILQVENQSPRSSSAKSFSRHISNLAADTDQRYDGPLDLSKKPPKPLSVPNEPTRKTHIYSELASSPAPSSSSLLSTSPASLSFSQRTSLSSLSGHSLPNVDTKPGIPGPFTYPLNTAMIESIFKMKEELKRHQEAADIANPFSHFTVPVSASFPGFYPRQFTALHRLDLEKTNAPLINLDNPSDFQSNRNTQQHPSYYPHHFEQRLTGKSKERYICRFCGKVFPRSANLTRHLRTHTGEQPYKCKYCERSFSISSNLQRHVRNIHNKEKPFRCPLCDRCFGQQTNLDRHLKKHEQEGPQVSESPTAELDERGDELISEIHSKTVSCRKQNDFHIDGQESEAVKSDDTDSEETDNSVIDNKISQEVDNDEEIDVSNESILDESL